MVMPETTIGIRELYTSIPKIARATSRGASFIVVKHAKPLFRIEPLETAKKEYTLSDFKKLQFKGGGKYTSRDIDSTVYGHS